MASDLPRVTEILRCFSGMEYVDKQVLARAAQRGTTVHAICAGLAKGAWIPESTIDEELHGYIASFKQWAAAQVLAFPIIEKRLQDNHNLFTGQLDFVIKGSDNELYLVDLKTSTRPQKTYPIQMAAYKYLLEIHGVRIKAAMLVYLSKDGEFPDIARYDELDDETCVFFSALKCYQYFHRKKGDNYGTTDTENPRTAHPCCNGRADVHPEGISESQQPI